jgi:hypothetical protein
MAREVMRQTKAGSRDFLLDHHIDGAVAFILRLLGLAPEAAEPLPSRRPRAPARPLSPGP